MEHIHQPRGDADEITSQQHTGYENQQIPLPADVGHEVAQQDQRPPVTFTEAEAHNPYSFTY
jgi:hypothetical protein